MMEQDHVRTLVAAETDEEGTKIEMLIGVLAEVKAGAEADVMSRTTRWWHKDKNRYIVGDGI